jgi:formylglycine-generating enzyme required for sulfatase activity
MNKFEQQLLKAKKKQKLLFIGLTSFGLLGVLLIVAILIIPRGVRLVVLEPAMNAEVSVEKGPAFLFKDTLFSIFSEPEIEVSADGFKAKLVNINKQDFGKVKEIKLEPLPPKVVLDTGLTDGLTQWKVASEVVFIGDRLSKEMDVGAHQVALSHPYYSEKTIDLSLSPGEVYEFKIELTPIYGKLSINSTPNSAELFINGNLIGATAIEHELKGGEYKLEIKKENYETIFEDVKITRIDPDVSRDYKLEVKKATVNLELTPEGGELYLNNVSIPIEKQIKVKALVDNEIRYSKAGYHSEKIELNLSADQTRDLSIALKEAPGFINIKSEPSAEVIINNRSMGMTPLKLELPSVLQKVTIKKNGYRGQSVNIVPDPKREKVIDVRLITEKQAKISEAKPTYKNYAGGVLKLFKPSETYTMGADRSELGQRANEFLKQIKLTRAFYAGINEVTYAEYKKFNKNVSGAASNPVVSVSWIDAVKYCNWLSAKEKLTPVYNIKNNKLLAINNKADGYRLLTEAEWEWLARKSGKRKQTVFVWGDDPVIPKGMVNIADESARGSVKTYVPRYNDGYAKSAPVKSFAIEKSGLFDQGGNVSEWTHDPYIIEPPVAGKIYANPFSTDIGYNHVIKGANWRSGSITELRASFREGSAHPRDDVGFRLARYVYAE